MKHVITTAAAAVAAALVLTTGGVAHAERDSVDDSVRDVWRGSFGTSQWEQAGTRDNADIDASVAKHGRRQLVLTQQMKSLRKRGGEFLIGWQLKDDEGNRYVAYSAAGPEDWRGQPVVFPTSSMRTRFATERGLPCPGATTDISYRRDTVTLTVPRSCVGRPEWIKAKSLAQRRIDDSTAYIDNGHNDGHGRKGWTEKLSRG